MALAYPHLRMCPIVPRYSMDGGRADHEQLCKSSAIATAVFHPYIRIPHIATHPTVWVVLLLLPETFMPSHIDLITYYSSTHNTPSFHISWQVCRQNKTPHIIRSKNFTVGKWVQPALFTGTFYPASLAQQALYSRVRECECDHPMHTHRGSQFPPHRSNNLKSPLFIAQPKFMTHTFATPYLHTLPPSHSHPPLHSMFRTQHPSANICPPLCTSYLTHTHMHANPLVHSGNRPPSAKQRKVEQKLSMASVLIRQCPLAKASPLLGNIKLTPRRFLFVCV